MTDRAGTTSSAANPSSSGPTVKHEGRNVWVLTAYGISGLVLLGVLAYYISQYVAN